MAERLSPEVRRALLTKNARKLFLKHGFENVRVDDIMLASKISKGGFYHHFKSKDEVLETLIAQEFSQLADQIKTPKSGHEPAALINLFAVGSKFLDDQNSILASLREVATKSQFLDEIELRLDQILKPALVQLIAQGSASKTFPNVDAAMTAELFMAANNYANKKSLLGQWTDAQTIAFSKAAILTLGQQLNITGIFKNHLGILGQN